VIQIVFIFALLFVTWFLLFGCSTLPEQSKSAILSKQDGPTLRVKEVDFVGNRVFTDAELRRQLEVTGDGGFWRSILGRNIYTPEGWQADATRLTQYMADRGYLKASVGNPSIEYINPGDETRSEGDIPIRLIIRINEGPIHRLLNLVVQEGKVVNDQFARAQFEIKFGDVVRANLLEQGLNRLRHIYGRQGYIKFAPAIDFKFIPISENEVLVDLTITLKEGPLFILGRLEVTGNQRTLDAVIRRMIPLYEGEVFDYSKLVTGIERINRTGLFEPLSMQQLKIDYDTARGIANVELPVVERDRQRIDFSGGGGTTGGVSLGIDYENHNLTGRADSLSGQIRIGNFERILSGRYSRTLLTSRPIDVSFSGFYQRIEFVNAGTGDDRLPLYIQNASGLNFGLGVPLEGGRNSLAAPTRAGIYYSFTSSVLEELVAPGTPMQRYLEQPSIRTGTLTPFLLHDTMERGFDPRRGRRLSLGVDFGGRWLGGNINTIQPRVDYRQFIPLGLFREEPRVLGFRVRASHIAGFGTPFVDRSLSTVDGVPIFNRYFLGGEHEVRGYRLNSISPLARIERFLVVPDLPPILIASDLRPIGGDTELIFNAEYIVPLKSRLSLAAFFDIGTSFNARRLNEQRAESSGTLEPEDSTATLVTILRPLERQLTPAYRASFGAELRFSVPALNLPLRLIFAVNPNAQVRPVDPALFVPEKRFAFVIGFSRTL
jgi:outer membrane protein insertion porin family